MKRMKTLFAAAMVCVALLANGCSDAVSSGDPLDQAQAEELAGVIVAGGFAGLGSSGLFSNRPGPAAGAAASPYTITINVNDSAPCEMGGTFALEGSLTLSGDDETGEVNLAFDYTQDANDCVVEGEEGTVFTLNGDPNVRVQGTIEGTETSISGSVSHTGGVAWASGESAGSCQVNLVAEYDVVIEGEGGSATASISGTICGISVSRSISVTGG